MMNEEVAHGLALQCLGTFAATFFYSPVVGGLRIFWIAFSVIGQ
jgi:hypothetical protein